MTREIDPVDLIGVLADTYVRVLLLADRGLSDGAIADRLGVDPAAVPALIRIAHQKLAELESTSSAERPSGRTTGTATATDPRETGEAGDLP
jgi:hypothetical protein